MSAGTVLAINAKCSWLRSDGSCVSTIADCFAYWNPARRVREPGFLRPCYKVGFVGLFVQYQVAFALREGVLWLQNGPSMKYFKAIAAMSENRVIGNGNKIPWHLPEDFKWFKGLTTGKVIVMGRKTFQSIGKPLPDRTTIVVSRSGFSYPGVTTVKDWRDIDLAGETREVFICGGAEIYAQTLPICSDLFLTVVKRTVDGDAFFPEFENDFKLLQLVRQTDEFTILQYRNKNLGLV
jgi:dihydrofolate reductase